MEMRKIGRRNRRKETKLGKESLIINFGKLEKEGHSYTHRDVYTDETFLDRQVHPGSIAS